MSVNITRQNRLMGAITLIAASTIVCVGACGGDPSPYYGGGDVNLECRESPADCDGDVGGACGDDFDCFDGVCCSDKNCGGGMCTYLCDGDLDCPGGMACEHGYCFFECDGDGDCGPGQKCEHGKTICEYEGWK